MRKKLLILLIITILFNFSIAYAQEDLIIKPDENSEEVQEIDTQESVNCAEIREIDGQKYYFDEQGNMQKGFVFMDGKKYFFSRISGALKTGWQCSEEGKWYQAEDGSLVIGIQEIDGEKYYFNEEGMMKTGFILYEGKIYFFSRVNGVLKSGWQGSEEGKWYQESDGSLAIGIHQIDNQKYYFNEEGMMTTGFVSYEGKKYFFSRVSGTLKTGWQGSEEGKWYQESDGSLAIGIHQIDNQKYYFNEEGMMTSGFISYEGKNYFFSRVNGVLKKGLQGNPDGVWYQKEDGEVVYADGFLEVEGKEFYFEGRSLKSGFIEIDGKTYYFNKDTYEKQYESITNKYSELVLNHETGEYVKKQYHPVYYRQKDSRWNNKKYGLGTMGMTGCAPTGMAMAYTSILQREVLPTEVANFLYYNTDQFNRRLKGTSGMGIIHASNYFNVKWTGIGTKEEMIDALKQGKIVYASMQNGKFAKPTYNHIIIMYNYNENLNRTYTLDPLTQLNNGWTDVDLIWREQCMDPDDRTGGYAFYSLEEK